MHSYSCRFWIPVLFPWYKMTPIATAPSMRAVASAQPTTSKTWQPKKGRRMCHQPNQSTNPYTSEKLFLKDLSDTAGAVYKKLAACHYLRPASLPTYSANANMSLYTLHVLPAHQCAFQLYTWATRAGRKHEYKTGLQNSLRSIFTCVLNSEVEERNLRRRWANQFFWSESDVNLHQGLLFPLVYQVACLSPTLWCQPHNCTPQQILTFNLPPASPRAC